MGAGQVLATSFGYEPFPRGRYRIRFAQSVEDLDAVLVLRFEVFNLELGEGLDSSCASGRDHDRFDPGCHHLMVEDLAEGRVVGTYRMQTLEMAARSVGFYSAGEFDLSSLPSRILEEAVEVCRACIARPYRNRQVLFLLWKGLAAYLSGAGKRYLFGCSSLTSQDPAEGLRALEDLTAKGHLHPTLRVQPLPGLECVGERSAGAVHLPVLFQSYLRHGAKVCGSPALDRAFKTIDFFTILDTFELGPEVRRLYF